MVSTMATNKNKEDNTMITKNIDKVKKDTNFDNIRSKNDDDENNNKDNDNSNIDKQGGQVESTIVTNEGDRVEAYDIAEVKDERNLNMYYVYQNKENGNEDDNRNERINKSTKTHSNNSNNINNDKSSCSNNDIRKITNNDDDNDNHDHNHDNGDDNHNDNNNDIENGKDNGSNNNTESMKEKNTKIFPNTIRSTPVVPPEKHDGNVEYKRHVHKASAARLRSLATQMSFRLDEGQGVCMYRIGVEDGGCHSLLDYNSISESARILECIARSLNSIVIERKIIQNEIIQDDDGNHVVVAGSSVGDSSADVVEVIEPSVLGNGHEEEQQKGENIQTHSSNSNLEGVRINNSSSKNKLNKEPGVFTRAEVTMQRIRTHLLDETPISPVEWVEATATAASTVDTTATETSSMTGDTSGKASSLSPTLSADASTSSALNSEQASQQQAAPAPPQQQKQKPGCGTSNVMPIGETLSSRNIRVAVLGNVDAGKSTLIGTLTTSCLDDGCGRTRTSIMKHRHEIESGRTSTVSTHLMGFRSTGKPITGRDHLRTQKRKTEDEIALESYRVITLMDLAGHEKYLKTTIHGVTSGMSDYALVLVNSKDSPTVMTQQHLNLCCSFKIPVIVVLTKVDGCPDKGLSTTRAEVKKLLRSVGKKPFDVRNEQDIADCMDKLQVKTPIIETSCVTGHGISLLQKMLFSLPKRRRHEGKVNRPFEFLVEDIFLDVPGVGPVVSGFVNAGELTVGPNCNVFVGPTSNGSFMKTVAKSAHIARINTTHIMSGQSACLAVLLNKELRNNLRRGMVVLRDSPTSTRHFDAEICVLKGEATTIRQSKSYQAFVHILNVRQSAFARKIEIVSHGSRSIVNPVTSKKALLSNNDNRNGNGKGNGNGNGNGNGYGNGNENENGIGNGNENCVGTNDDSNHEQTEERGQKNKDNSDNGTSDGVLLRPGSRAKVRFEFAQRPEYIRPGMRMFFRDGRARGVGIITGTSQIQAVN